MAFIFDVSNNGRPVTKYLLQINAIHILERSLPLCCESSGQRLRAKQDRPTMYSSPICGVVTHPSRRGGETFYPHLYVGKRDCNHQYE